MYVCDNEDFFISEVGGSNPASALCVEFLPVFWGFLWELPYYSSPSPKSVIVAPDGLPPCP